MRGKTFIGPRLRRLRGERGETQAHMAKALGVSASYVNLLENNQRSVSVQVLLRLLTVYGVDWREIAEDEGSTLIADLRASLQDPLFESARPDLAQLRAALVHAPTLAAAFLRLHESYRNVGEQLLAVSEGAADAAGSSMRSRPESVVHNFFRRHRNHFPKIEDAAAAFWNGGGPEPDDVYGALKERLRAEAGIAVRVVPVETLPHTLRVYDEARREIVLSQALDLPNRVFQLVHVMGLVQHSALFDDLLARAGPIEPQAQRRLRIELANYFAAAVSMPYDAFLQEARASKWDFDRLATRFGISFEQACHRATTLQREGANGVPFFFLRVDRAGNVTKRFNATDFHLAEFGGACPRLEVHAAFRMPGMIVSQFVEMPDRSRYFVIARTVERPVFERFTQGPRLAVALGCSVEHVGEVGYAEAFALSDLRMTPIGINCRICPREQCDQRAHEASVHARPIDERRRGATRFES